jgi:hypothetical protein
LRYELRTLVLVGVLAVLSGCHTPHNTYAELVNEPPPTSDQNRDAQCAWIRSEIARQQTVGEMGASMQTTPMAAAMYRGVADKNIAYLQSRYSQIQCDVVRVAPTAPVVPAQPSTAPTMSLEECVAECRKLTSRTDAECFDACRH